MGHGGFSRTTSPRGGELVAQLLPQVRATIFSAHGVAPEKCHWLVLVRDIVAVLVLGLELRVALAHLRTSLKDWLGNSDNDTHCAGNRPFFFVAFFPILSSVPVVDCSKPLGHCNPTSLLADLAW
jgi:hypothetical protein